MNHIISELLPERGGQRYANADPVTGQAAWFDLRVRIEKAPAGRGDRAAFRAAKPLPSSAGAPVDPALWRKVPSERAT